MTREVEEVIRVGAQRDSLSIFHFHGEGFAGSFCVGLAVDDDSFGGGLAIGGDDVEVDAMVLRGSR